MSSTEDYNVTDDKHIDVGNYTVTVTLKDSDNYKWDATGNSEALTLSYSIIKANINITVTIDGWTFGENANAPFATADFGRTVFFKYSTAQNGEYTETVPTQAGTYYVKAFAKGNENLNDSESAPVAFVIARAVATIEGAQERYETVYNKEGYDLFAGITASNGLTLDYTFSKNGETVSQILNAGEYTVVIKLEESENYLGDEVTVTVKINKVVNEEAIPTYNATYGDKLSTLAVPTSEFGTWKWQNANDLVGNAGKQTHKLVFVPNDAENYEERTADATVTVAKQVVSTPTAPADRAYTNTLYTSGITNTDLYTVEDAGGTNKGTYKATLTLTDPDNYVWDNGTETTTVSYTITAGTNELSNVVMNDWTYDKTGHAGSATAKYGDVLIEYLVNGEYTTEVPVNAGTYTARFTATDENCAAVSTTRNFTVAKQKVATPAIALDKQSQFYTGETLTSGLVTGEIYRVTDAGGVNVGTYYATLSLIDKTNYEWNEGGNADATLSYEIKKATVQFSNLAAGWEYNDFKAPSVTVTPAVAQKDVEFWYSTDGGAIWTQTPPTEVGSYKIKVLVSAGTSNYVGSEVIRDFTIGRATPTWTTPSFVGGKYYQNRFSPSTSGMVASHKGTTIAGTFAYSEKVFVDGENASYITLTFTPDDQKNYKPVTVTYNFTLATVAYLNNTTPYGTIEEALMDAFSGDIVWVRPYDTELGPIYIMENITVKENVTLLLPYGADGSGRNSFDKNGIVYDLHGGTDYDADGDPNNNSDICVVPYGVEGYCYVKVVVAQGVTVSNYGMIEIAGQLSAGNGGAPYSGHTGGQHAELLLDNGAFIDNYGKIRVAGFISEVQKNGGSQVIINSGSTLYMPYVLADFQGGSFSYAVKNAMDDKYPVTAFNRFMMMNVSPLLTVKQGGLLEVWAGLYASNSFNTTSAIFIGGSTAVIELHANAYLTAKYDVATEVCVLNIYGGATSHPMVLEVLSIPVSTETCFLPITYHYNVTLHPLYDENGSPVATAEYILDQRFKLMPGSVFTVEKGAKLTINTLMVYTEATPNADGTYTSINEVYNGFLTGNANGGTVPRPYPTSAALREKGILSDCTTGTLTVNGQMICENDFGGKIYSNTNGASISVAKTGYTVYEIHKHSGSSFLTKVAAYNKFIPEAALVGTTNTVSNINLNTTYTYENGEWIVGHVSFNSNGGSACDPIGVADAYLNLPTPTRDGYEFLGWYYNDALVSNGEAPKVAGDHTLTAKWKSENEVWITVGLDSSGDGVADSSVQFNPAEGNVYPSFPTPTKDGYRFDGWTYNGKIVKAGDTVTATGDHVLTAKWAKLYTITVTTSYAEVSGVATGDKAAAGDTISVTVKFTEDKNKTLTYNGTSLGTSNGTYTFTMPEGDVTINASSEKSSTTCLAAGTLITLSDGSKKAVEDLRQGDLVMSFDHLTGQIVYKNVIIVVRTYEDFYYRNTFVFSDGTELATINEHGIFDLDLNKYVNIDHMNYEQYIGHRFVSVDTNGNLGVKTLVDVVTVLETGYKYDIVTEGTLNYVAEDTLSVTHVLVDVINSFDFGENLMYDQEKMMADIETYGLYTYDEWEEYCDISVFEEYNIPVMKVGISKGLYTKEYIIGLINTYVLDESVQIID